MASLIKDKLADGVLLLLTSWDVLDVLSKDKSDHFLPVLVKYLLTNFVCSNAVGTKALHSEVIDEATFLSILDICFDLLVSEFSADES